MIDFGPLRHYTAAFWLLVETFHINRPMLHHLYIHTQDTSPYRNKAFAIHLHHLCFLATNHNPRHRIAAMEFVGIFCQTAYRFIPAPRTCIVSFFTLMQQLCHHLSCIAALITLNFSHTLFPWQRSIN